MFLTESVKNRFFKISFHFWGKLVKRNEKVFLVGNSHFPAKTVQYQERKAIFST